MSYNRSDAEVLGRYVTYEPPPSGFEPLTAPDQLLVRYGFPHRPDPNKEPRLSTLWEETLSRPIKIIRAELAVDRSRPQRVPLRPKQGAFDIKGGWAGAQVNTASLGFSPAEPANTVYGQWIVPTVTLPPNTPQQTLIVGFWVGLGGDQANNSTQLVQAGTQAIVQGNNVTYSAFTEWWTQQYQDPPVTVPNFPVAPGDRMGFLVCTPQPDHAFASMLNYTTGVATTVAIKGRTGITNDGTSAEWIVEGDPPLLADFFAALFAQCLGGTKNHDFDLTHAIRDEILSSNGVTILAATGIILPNAVGVVWEGGGP